MEKFKKNLIYVLFGIGIPIVFYIFYCIGLFDILDLKFSDFFYKFRPQRQHNKNIVIIDVDEDSLEKLGQYPWKRSIHAKLIRELIKDKNNAPKVIAFDHIFPEEDKHGINEDKEFAKAIKEAGNVIVGFQLYEKSDTSVSTFEENGITTDIKRIQFPIDPIKNACNGVGFTTIPKDPDSIIRRMTILYYDNDFEEMFYSFAAVVAMNAMDIKKDKVQFKRGYIMFGTNKIPLDPYKMAIIDYAGGLKTYKYIPYWKMFDKEEPRAEDYFKDKIVLIGGTASGLHDNLAVPITDSNFPGVEIQANVIDNLINGSFLKRTSYATDFVIFLFLGLLLGIILPYSPPARNAVVAALFLLIFAGASFFLFAFKKLIIPTASGILVISITFVLITVYRLVSEEREKKLITKEKDKFYELAIFDSLTKLYHVRYFKQYLTESMEKAMKTNTPLSLIMIDLDNFKSVNDTFGHQQGDIVLRETAAIIKDNMRSKTDIPARYGGEEMTIVLPDTTTEDAFMVADRIRKAVNEHIYSGSFPPEKRLSGSFGVSTFPIHAKTEKDLIEKADVALYEAKHTGKNKVCIAKEGEARMPEKTDDGHH